MTEARLLCVGDMHLGRRPGRLPEAAPDDIDPRAAWAAVVEVALERRVDAVLLAGDVVESRNGYMEAYGALRSGVASLREHGIDVVAVAGNHDVEVLPRLARELDDVRLLGRGGSWESFVVRRAGEPVVRVVGWSFPERVFESSPLDALGPAQRRHSFDDEAPDELQTVGLLHCDLDASGGGYAPVSRSALAGVGFSAWFLGHVHAPSISSGERPLGYLGSLVAMDPGEPGLHGPWLAESLAGSWKLQQLALSPVRWETLQIDVSECEDGEAVQSRLLQAAHELHATIQSRRLRVVGLRPRLVGETRLGADELRAALQAARELSAEPRDEVLYFFDKGRDDTRPALDLEQLALGTDPAALLARRLLALQRGDDEGQRALEEARPLLARVASDVRFQALEAVALDDGALRELLLRTATRALRELLAQRTEAEVSHEPAEVGP